MIVREVVKKRCFTIRLTVSVDPTTPLRSAFCEFSFGVWKTCFLDQKHCSKPFSVGQKIHIYSQGRGPPRPLMVSLTVKYLFFLTISLRQFEWIKRNSVLFINATNVLWHQFTPTWVFIRLVCINNVCMDDIPDRCMFRILKNDKDKFKKKVYGMQKSLHGWYSSWVHV